MDRASLPYLGFGLGLRAEHYETILSTKPAVDWFEIITENYMVQGGKPLYYLDKIREHYPLVMHGVSLSIGGTDSLDKNYLKQLKELMQRVQPHWISDHLCWTGTKGYNLHDLLPLPYTVKTIEHVVSRIDQVQNYLGQRILIENVSSYLTYQDSEMSEWEFVNEIAQRADCLLLLDINNVYVSGFNHHFNPHTYLDHIAIDKVQQFHLAGHSLEGDYIIDTHDSPVIPDVWELYQHACKRFGKISTMIERDDNIPPFNELFKELQHAKTLFKTLDEAVLS